MAGMKPLMSSCLTRISLVSGLTANTWPTNWYVGASGARLVTTAVNQLHAIKGRYALCTMCIGVGQGIALIIERV